MQYSNAQIGLGTLTPDPSAVLDINSSTKGILISRMISNDRDAIFEPAKGLLIYNLTIDFIQVNVGTSSLPEWISVIGLMGATGPTATGVIAFGLFNIASGENTSAIAGTYNVASGLNSTVTGGTYDYATGVNAATLGGSTNNAIGNNSVSLGGAFNVALELNASSVGGTVNEANGISSSVIGGTTNNASGVNSSIIGGTTSSAKGEDAFVAGGSVNSAEGKGSGIIAGSINNALNTDTVILGGSINIASGISSAVVGGTVNAANAINAIVLGGTTINSIGINSGVLSGTTNSALGLNSIVICGSTNTAVGENSCVAGGGTNFAYGNLATVSGGYGNQAKSYGEWVGGINTTDYTAASATEFVATDRLFNIGNGVAAGARNDALTIFKNGLAIMPHTTGDMIGAASPSTITNIEYTAANYSKYSTIPPSSASDKGSIGEIRMTANYIFTCYAANTWVRLPVSNWVIPNK